MIRFVLPRARHPLRIVCQPRLHFSDLVGSLVNGLAGGLGGVGLAYLLWERPKKNAKDPEKLANTLLSNLKKNKEYTMTYDIPDIGNLHTQFVENMKEQLKKRDLWIVYGQRGMGKTTALKYFLKDKSGMYFCLREVKEAKVWSKMANVLGVDIFSNDLAEVALAKAFQKLEQKDPENRPLIVLDDIQYFTREVKDAEPFFNFFFGHVVAGKINLVLISSLKITELTSGYPALKEGKKMWTFFQGAKLNENALVNEKVTKNSEKIEENEAKEIVKFFGSDMTNLKYFLRLPTKEDRDADIKHEKDLIRERINGVVFLLFPFITKTDDTLSISKDVENEFKTLVWDVLFEILSGSPEKEKFIQIEDLRNKFSKYNLLIPDLIELLDQQFIINRFGTKQNGFVDFSKPSVRFVVDEEKNIKSDASSSEKPQTNPGSDQH